MKCEKNPAFFMMAVQKNGSPEVLEEVQREMVNYKGCGMSVMEMSHRSKEFMAIAAEAEKNLRDIFGVPSTEASAGIPSGYVNMAIENGHL